MGWCACWRPVLPPVRMVSLTGVRVATGANGRRRALADEAESEPGRRRWRMWLARVQALVAAIRDGDPAKVERGVLDLSQSRRILAPLGFLVGAFVTLFDALRLLVSNWRLMLVQILPATWIWLAMFDLKAHLLHGRAFREADLTVTVILIAVITAITMVSFLLNAVFAFAIARPGSPQIRPAFRAATDRLPVILLWGLVAGLGLAFAALIAPRLGRGWFGVSMGLVVGFMMLTYVTVPARLVGIHPSGSRRDKLGTSVVTGAIGAVVCAPAYILGRLGILLLGSHALFAVGVGLLFVGLMLQAGASGAVKAMKMSAKLLAGRDPEAAPDRV